MQDTNDGPLSIHNTVLLSFHIKGLSMYLIATRTGETAHCILRISGFTKICNKKITFQCIIFIVPEEGWFGQPKYSTHIKTFLRCTGFCLYFLHFIYVKPVRSPLIQRTPAGSSFRLLAQTFHCICAYICILEVLQIAASSNVSHPNEIHCL